GHGHRPAAAHLATAELLPVLALVRAGVAIALVHRKAAKHTPRTLVESPRGPLRPHDPAAARGGSNRHRPVRRGAAAAVERRRARRPLLPRLPQRALPVHRRQGAAGGADGAGRDRRRPSVHPPPGRVRARLHTRARDAARRPRGAARGQVEPRPAGAPDPLDGRLHRPRLGRPRHARAVQRGEPPDPDLPRDEDGPAVVRGADGAGRDAVRLRGARLEVPGPAGPDAEPLLAELLGGFDGTLLALGAARPESIDGAFAEPSLAEAGAD